MIGAQTDQAVQEHLIEKYMLLPNQVWDSIIQQATKVSPGSPGASHMLLLAKETSISSCVLFFCFLLERGHPQGPGDCASARQHPEDQREGV